MSVHLATTGPLALVGTTVTLEIELYVDPNGVAGPAATGLGCTLTPALTGIVGIGAESSCSLSGSSLGLQPGDRVWLVGSATAAGVTLINTVDAVISVGLAA